MYSTNNIGPPFYVNTSIWVFDRFGLALVGIPHVRSINCFDRGAVHTATCVGTLVLQKYCGASNMFAMCNVHIACHAVIRSLVYRFTIRVNREQIAMCHWQQ